MSESEPELGLGLITEISSKQIQILFPGSETSRMYGKRSSPLRRVVFSEGEKIELETGESLTITDIECVDGLYYYSNGEIKISETQISGQSSYNHPEEKIFVGQVDPLEMFRLRKRTVENKKRWERNKLKGLMGGRIGRIPHQLHLTSQVCQMPWPRALLADEVGLGKTIEAGLVLHHFRTTERAERILIVVPDSLEYQWFQEMYRKFKLGFSVVNQEYILEEGSNPFLDHDLVITGMSFLLGSEKAKELCMEAKWDILVVDEAHGLKTEREDEGPQFGLIKELGKEIPGLLLLSGTPNASGPFTLFSLLNLVDPNKFFDFDQYLKEMEKYSEIGDLIVSIQDKGLNENSSAIKKYLPGADNLEQNEVINSLVDIYGTGRTFIRNTREKLDREYKFFPKRNVHFYPLEESQVGKLESWDNSGEIGVSFKRKVQWLLNFLKNHGDEKILLICKSKAKVLKLDGLLRKETTSLKWGLFHSDLSLMARDRQAVYFADPKGAQILLCTEIGTEGRNFEFSHHLILFDLPFNPDLLEQRIGRLDRIGQKKDINIHLPFIQNSWEEVLSDWYNRGINGLSNYSKSGRAAFIHFKDQLIASMTDSKVSEKLIDDTKSYVTENDKLLNSGRDLLLELNSFNHDNADKLVELLKDADEGAELPQYLDQVFSFFGVDVEELDSESLFIKPNSNMFIPHFPSLPKDGRDITYLRSKALSRENQDFVSWDHPMVQGIMDLILSEHLGNCTAVIRKARKKPALYMECFFRLEYVGPKNLDFSRNFSTELIRVLINDKGEDISEKWGHSFIDENTQEIPVNLVSQLKNIPRDKVKNIIKVATSKAEEIAALLNENNVEEYLSSYLDERERQNELVQICPERKELVEESLLKLEIEKSKMLELALNPKVNFDSVRFIL